MTLTATSAATTSLLAAAEAEWFAAVAEREAFDARRARWNASTTPGGRRSAARSWGSRRAPLTRRIIRAEQAIDALRG